MAIHVKRVYEPAAAADGERFLVDRLWPRGISKADLKLEAWLKDAAPSNELRSWYQHEPEKWPEFQRRYRLELEANPAAWKPLLEAARRTTITLLFSSRELERNNAAALKLFLQKKL